MCLGRRKAHLYEHEHFFIPSSTDITAHLCLNRLMALWRFVMPRSHEIVAVFGGCPARVRAKE